jgi:hypothetical protein
VPQLLILSLQRKKQEEMGLHISPGTSARYNENFPGNQDTTNYNGWLGGGVDGKPSCSVSLWNNQILICLEFFRYKPVWRAGIGLPGCHAISPLHHRDLPKKHLLYPHKRNCINGTISHHQDVSPLETLETWGGLFVILQISWYIVGWFNISTSHMASLGLIVSSLDSRRIMRSHR